MAALQIVGLSTLSAHASAQQECLPVVLVLLQYFIDLGVRALRVATRQA